MAATDRRNKTEKDSVKAAYAALLSSLLTGTSVEFYGFNTNCTVGQMHVLKQ